MKDCIFCQIADHQAEAKIVFENNEVIAFEDINKDAPEHILIVPKKHIPSINDVNKKDREVLGEIILAAKEIAKKRGIDKSGFRLIANTGKDGGQIINHLHFHLLGGQPIGPIVAGRLKKE